jgi:hypothetical protein
MLSRKDIESCNFILHENSGLYFCDHNEYKLRQSLDNPLLIEIFSNKHNVGYNDTIFLGTIKNKTELKQILKMLNV